MPGLTDAQHKAREGKLTGSRVAPLMTGDAAGVLKVWEIMTGERAEDDLSDVWAVQHGIVTEPLNLDWFERRNKVPVYDRGTFVTHPKYPWAGVTLDGRTDERCIEAKAVGGNEPKDVVVLRYQPQLQWIMECTNTNDVALSMIIAGKEPIVDYIDRDRAYGCEALKRGLQFMEHVWAKTPPVVLPPAPVPVVANRIFHMVDDPMWLRWSGIWLQTRGAAESAAEAEKVLKSLVPPDAILAHGAGVRISRDRAGRLSLRTEENPTWPTGPT